MNKIKYLVLDVDGTLTDGKIYIGENGELFKAFNVKDGYGLSVLAPQNNITPVLITGRKSLIVSKRSEELGITHVFQGVVDKKECLVNLLEDLSKVAYMGDDINDLSTIEMLNSFNCVTGCPKDANEYVKKKVSFISSLNGGEGAVREFIDWIIDKNKHI